MTTNEFYYLMTACGAFTIFGLALALNYIQYRSWLKRQPTHRG